VAEFDPYQHFGFLTHRVSRLMDLLMTPRMKAEGYDFPASCIGIMADLWSKDGVTQKELGSSMIKTKSSVTKMLESLDKASLIEKKDDPSDKRNKLIYLTPKGHDFKALIQEKSSLYQKELMESHSAEELETTKRVLKTIYINLKEKISNEDKI
jgi:DNA-binding MarR family transcriptional regulator